MMPPRIAVLTISDGVVAGTRDDTSGGAIAAWIEARGSTIAARDVVPDAPDRISAALLVLADRADVDVVLTTGGTGFTTRDITPEATRAVIERDVPGIAERLRAVGAAATPYAALSRGIAGLRGSTLIVNLPGSAGGVRDGLRVLDDIIDHAVQLMRGVDTESHDPPNG
ncbi:MAG TPA: MogA/MoaB family molybdenum cofactor biosynthesis protein [Longimicrobiales bacterium]|nr:MogA/MoaB family molybdenum cofactor biosynthesis protein [Longimicrobiales bacterium]